MTCRRPFQDCESHEELTDSEIEEIWSRAEEDSVHAWGPGYRNGIVNPYPKGSKQAELYANVLLSQIARQNGY